MLKSSRDFPSFTLQKNMMHMEKRNFFHFPTQDHFLAPLGRAKRKLLWWFSDKTKEQDWDQPQILPELQHFQENKFGVQCFFLAAFPLVSKWAVMAIQVFPKTFHCEIRIQLGEVCASHCQTWAPTSRFCYTYWSWLMLHHEPVTDGFNSTINGNFKKCLWILNPAGDGVSQ